MKDLSVFCQKNKISEGAARVKLSKLKLDAPYSMKDFQKLINYDDTDGSVNSGGSVSVKNFCKEHGLNEKNVYARLWRAGIKSPYSLIQLESVCAKKPSIIRDFCRTHNLNESVVRATLTRLGKRSPFSHDDLSLVAAYLNRNRS